MLAVATVAAIQEKYHVMKKINRRCNMSEKLKVLIINGSPRAGGVRAPRRLLGNV